MGLMYADEDDKRESDEDDKRESDEDEDEGDEDEDEGDEDEDYVHVCHRCGRESVLAHNGVRLIWWCKGCELSFNTSLQDTMPCVNCKEPAKLVKDSSTGGHYECVACKWGSESFHWATYCSECEDSMECIRFTDDLMGKFSWDHKSCHC